MTRFLKLLIYKFLRLLDYLKPKRLYLDTRKINLCCGSFHIKSYTNVDRLQDADVVHDVLKPLPFESNSVEILIMSQALNYFTYEEAKCLVSEIYRVLKKSGIVRVSFPDLRIFAKAYIENDVGFLFQKLPNGKDRFVGKTIGDKFISLAYYYHGHKYFFDYESAREVFREAGFDVIYNCAYRESRIPDIELIDNRPELSCFLEAKK